MTSVKRFCPNSSQLRGDDLQTFRRKYPPILASAAEETHDSQNGRPKTSDNTRNAIKNSNKRPYSAGRDIAVMMCTIDAARLAPNNDSSSLFSNPREQDRYALQTQAQGNSPENVMSDESSVVCKVPSLAVLAQNVVTETMFHDSLCLEAKLEKNLGELRSNANDSIAISVQESQRELEDSKEAKRVQELRRQLQEAESALFDRQERMRQSCQEHVNTIQQQYDQDRAEAVAKYVKERDELIQKQSDQISLGDGAAVCSTCSNPFIPRDRDGLEAWERCSVPGCTSGESNCLKCSINFCRRCHVPVCKAHTPFHEAVCSSECKRLCGYWKLLDKLDTYDFCGMTRRTVCRRCDKPVCTNCSYGNSRFFTYCYGCFRFREQDHGRNAPKRKINFLPPWTGPEYERKRKRHRITGFDLTMAPHASKKASNEDWERWVHARHAKKGPVTGRL